ncbi:MAG TPA: ACT domain-containing protein [Syntrophomonadaceae bacterium]|nr:ACT domain-containing protein [Syntrophomonadaceae bacterium]
MKDSKKFFIVREDMLPASILKTARVKEMLAAGEADNIQEAVDELGMARSTYYKYKDGVFPFFNADSMNILNLSLLLQNHSGVLSAVLNCVASLRGNILTINQNLPLHDVAQVTLSVNVEEMDVPVNHFLAELRHISGVINAEIVGKS